MKISAYSTPTAQPATSATSTASQAGQPSLTNRIAMIAADSPLIEPTDRSIWPTSSTQTMPRAMIPTGTHSIRRFTRLVLDRKIGFRICSTTQITSSPAITGSMPSSPARTRFTRAVADPRRPCA